MLVAYRLAGLSALDAYYAGVVALTQSDASAPVLPAGPVTPGRDHPCAHLAVSSQEARTVSTPSPSRRGRNAAHGPPQGLGGAVQALLTAATPISADAFAGVRVRDKLCTA